VVAIISILVALTAGAYFKVAEGQKQSSTVTTVQKLSGVLDQQWQAVIDQAKKETIPYGVNQMSANNSGQQNPRRARVIWIKLRLKQEFPMNFTEAQQPWLTSQGQQTPYVFYSDLPPKPSYLAVQNSSNVPGPPQSSAQSSVLLWLIVQEHRRGMNFDVDKELSVRDASDAAPGLKAIVDAWGQPLAFIRWPTGSQDLNPGGPQAGRNDPQDPEGLLADPSWFNTPGWTAFTQLCHPLPNTAGPPPLSYKLWPVLASPGRDKNWGIDLNTMQTLDQSIAGDNIYNFIARMGSKGT